MGLVEMNSSSHRCAVDHFAVCVQESQRASMLEAMEQQTVSIAKAGMIATLQARTAVLGTTNPKNCKR